MRPCAVPLASLALSALLAHAAHAATPRVWAQSWVVSGRPTVSVEAHDGHVLVHPGPAGRVSARVVWSLRTWGMTLGGRDPQVSFERHGDAISVTVTDPTITTLLGGVVEHLAIEITMPAEGVLDVHTGDGAVDCDSISGQIRLSTGDGAIRAHGLRGDLVLTTGDGSLTADGLDGRLRARSGDGRVVVSGRFDGLELETGDGRLTATAAAGSKLEGPWTLVTGDGPLTLRIPRDLRAFLDAHTHDGTIRLDLPVATRGTMTGHSLAGDLNGGGPTLRLRTGDGSITVALADGAASD